MLIEYRVGGGTFTLPSHGTVLDSLPSHGFSCLLFVLSVLAHRMRWACHRQSDGDERVGKLFLFVSNVSLNLSDKHTCGFYFIFHILLFNINHAIIVSFLA